MYKYIAKVIRLNPEVEEEVTVDINGIEVTCFAGLCPYAIEVNKEYPVMFEFLDYELIEEGSDVEHENPYIKRLGKGYSYELGGWLSGDVIDFGIKIQEELLGIDHAYLDGKYIRLLIDRLDIEFMD